MNPIWKRWTRFGTRRKKYDFIFPERKLNFLNENAEKKLTSLDLKARLHITKFQQQCFGMFLNPGFSKLIES